MHLKRRHTQPSIRSKTAKLVLAGLVPSLIGFGTLAFDSFQRERANLLHEAERIAQALRSELERELDTTEIAGRALATSPSLQTGQLDAFRAHARAMLDAGLPANAFVLSDTTGRPLAHTGFDPGATLPPNPNAASIVRAAASGLVATSNLAHLGPGQQWLLSIEIPVRVDGAVRYVLSAHIAPARLGTLLPALHLPAQWSAAVYDGANVTITNTSTSAVGAPEHIGTRAKPALAAALANADAGTLELTARDGLPVFLVYTRLPQRGWVAAIDVPRAAANETLRNSLASVFLSVGALLVIGFAMAWRMGARIGRSMRALREPAIALGRGEPVLIPELDIREAAEVGSALRHVEQELLRFRAGLEDGVRERTEELENANALIANVYATAPAGLAMLDTDLRVVMVNDYLAAINNLPVADHIGKTLPELLGEQGVEYEKAYRTVRDTQTALLAIESHGQVPSEPGVEHHWIVSYHPIFNKDHKLVGVSGLVVDVSERKQLSDKLRDVSEQFHVLYEMSGDAHMLLTLNDGYVGGNRAAAVLFGCTDVVQLMTLSPAATSPEFQPDGRRSDEKAEQFIRYALERGSHQFEWLHQRIDGSLFHADILLTSLNAGGKGVIQATVRDISERIAGEARLQSLNEQLAHALDRAERASSAKSEFLANMSHEIRTPMNAIMGLARLLEESPLARRERSYVAKIKMSTRSLLGILNDVLDFSKIEAGQLMLEYTSFRLDQVLDSISVLLAPSAANKGLELVFAVAPDVPLQLTGDPMRLEQVLLNLVSNAIKFTGQGEVVLTIRAAGAVADDHITLAFSVRDTGIGIASEHQGHMFAAFSQADSSTSRKYGGTGLGLAICRRLVALMGGVIGVTSEPGKGAEFFFESTFGAPVGAPLAALPDLPGLAERWLLVVDDNASARAALAAQCTAFGWHVDTAADGHQALAMLRAANGPQRHYDFMLIDAAMPELDGISVLTHARAERGVELPRTALMVAEPTREQLAMLSEDLKLDATLFKPVTREALIAALVELHTGRAQGAPGQAQALAGRLAGIYVLLVEDNQLNQEVANYLLLHAGAAVDIAGDGRVAVEMLSATPTRYDAVLMDIQMPVMNGYEATEAIRKMGMADLPIIAMTANVMEDDRARAMQAGMNAHISKPIDVDSLIETVVRVTGGAPEAPGAPVRTGYHGTDHATPLPASIPGIDLRSTLPRFGGNFGNFVTLFKRFERSQGGTLAEVRQLLRAGEREAPVALVHRLRGVAANLGAADFAALALDFEHALRSGGMADLIERLDVLDGELARLMAAARQLDMPRGVETAAPKGDGRALHSRLADLLGLLQNSDLKAMAEFEALRAELAAVTAPDEMASLAESVATLAFPGAAEQIRELMNRKGTP